MSTTTNSTTSATSLPNDDNLVSDLSQKASFLTLNDTSEASNGHTHAQPTHFSLKFKQTYNRKSQNQIPYNRHYQQHQQQQQQIPYSSYPYANLSSLSMMPPNGSIPLMPPQTYIYPSSFTPNIYTRNNSNYANSNHKRIHNLNKLWPNTLIKQNTTTTNINNINNKETKRTENTSTESLLSPTTTPSIELTSQVKSDPTEENSDQAKTPEQKPQADNKTPMCLINELVRFNKIKHEYVLLDEIGPAHKKVFYIMLKLGIGTENEEVYEAQGSSIKKTQHAAADLALKQTKFKMPVKRDKTLSKSIDDSSTDNNQTSLTNSTAYSRFLTDADSKRQKKWTKTNPPTVKLNTLAMKLGLVANYTHSVTNYTNSLDYNLDLSKPQHKLFLNPTYDYPTYTSFLNIEYQPFLHQSFPHRQMHRSHQSYQIAQQIQRPKQIVNVTLAFANKEFKGKGLTLQLAKHDAAAKALEYFTNPDHYLEAKSLSTSNQNKTVKAYRPPQFYQQQQQQIEIQEPSQQSIEQSDNKKPNKPTKETNETKSEIQLVYEYANYLKKSVDFELIQESGPSHIKKFVTKCVFGELESNSSKNNNNNNNNKLNENVKTPVESNTTFPIETLGEGNSKKLSKKNSAIKMLTILKEKFEPLLVISTTKTAINATGDDAVQATTNSAVDADATKRNEQTPSQKNHRKSRAKNIDKIKKTSPEYGKGSINPISRLMQIQQAKKEKEPVFFELLPQTKKRVNQEFAIQVSVELQATTPGGSESVLKCEGRGSTKKLAKQRAAEAMLVKLGYQTRQPVQSVLKPSLKLSAQSSEDNSDGNASSELNETSKECEKTAEKKVKFVEDPNLKSEDSPTAGKLKPKPVNLEEKKKALNTTKIQMAHSVHLQKQQKFKQIQQNIANNNLTKQANGEMDMKHLDSVFKIAQELLDSVTSKSSSSANSNREFYSETAEQLLKSKKNQNDQSSTESAAESEENKIQFKILNGGVDAINYKKMLEYLADTLSFKVIYQSLLGRDGSVYSYVSLSILPETEKPLNGHGTTHIESSNAAALCALQYLASKHTQTKKLSASSTKLSNTTNPTNENSSDLKANLK